MHEAGAKKNFEKIFAKWQRLIFFVVVIVGFTLLLPGRFLTWTNMRNNLYAVSLTGIMCCGATFCVLLGGIDRAVAGNGAMASAACCAWIVSHGYTSQSALVGILIGLSIATLSGFLHGVVLANFDIPAFLLTLASNQILYGLVRVLLGNALLVVMEPPIFTAIGTRQILGIPFPVYMLLICFLLSTFILNHTTYGRRVYMVGGNREASHLSGINVKKITITAYTISGFMAGIAGIILASMNCQGDAKACEGYENDVLAAIVLGGVSIRGGSGKIWQSMYGVILIGIIVNGMRLMGLNVAYHDMVKGIIIIIAVALDAYTRRKASGMLHEGLFKRWRHKHLKKIAAG